MLTWIDGMYIEPKKVQDSSNPKVANKELLDIDWTFSVYSDDFSHSDELVLQAFNMG